MTSAAGAAEHHPAGRVAAQRWLARHLVGDGVELGPGHAPFPLPYPGVRVRYVDRWEPATNHDLFPELAGETFPEPDIVADLDVDRLRALGDASLDFVIASHVLEHVAEPIGLLADIHRVLRPGGVTVVLLPDRRRTFDSERAPTPLEHLLHEHAEGVTRVDDAHLDEFLRATGEPLDDLPAVDLPALFEHHRRRSIHAHCWTEDEFAEVLEHCVGELAQDWELVDVLNVEDATDSLEFGVVLRRAIPPQPPALARARSHALRAELGPGSPGAPRASAPDELAARLRRSRLYPLLRGAWRLRQRLRRGA